MDRFTSNQTKMMSDPFCTSSEYISPAIFYCLSVCLSHYITYLSFAVYWNVVKVYICHRSYPHTSEWKKSLRPAAACFSCFRKQTPLCHFCRASISLRY